MTPGHRIAMDPAQPEDHEHTCLVTASPDGGYLVLQLYDDRSPLREVYEDISAKYEFFEATQVGGFPAVRRASWRDIIDECEVIVGTAENQGFTLINRNGDRTGGRPAWCARVETVAQAILKRLGA